MAKFVTAKEAVKHIENGAVMGVSRVLCKSIQ